MNYENTIEGCKEREQIFAPIIGNLIDQLGGDKFIAEMDKVKPYIFTKEVFGFLSGTSAGIRIEKDNKVLFIIYDEGSDLYIINVGKGCKNPQKIYGDVYYDMLNDIVKKEFQS